MIPKEDIRALISVNNDQLALVMDEEKEAELHGVIGKVREIILHLPDSSIVLQIDFSAQVLSTAGNEYRTNLKIGLKRARIDIFYRRLRRPGGSCGPSVACLG